MRVGFALVVLLGLVRAAEAADQTQLDCVSSDGGARRIAYVLLPETEGSDERLCDLLEGRPCRGEDVAVFQASTETPLGGMIVFGIGRTEAEWPLPGALAMVARSVRGASLFGSAEIRLFPEQAGLGYTIYHAAPRMIVTGRREQVAGFDQFTEHGNCERPGGPAVLDQQTSGMNNDTDAN